MKHNLNISFGSLKIGVGNSLQAPSIAKCQTIGGLKARILRFILGDTIAVVAPGRTVQTLCITEERSNFNNE